MIRKKEKLDGYIKYLNETNYQSDGKPVVQLDFDGNLVCKYKNANNTDEFDAGAIGHCCKGDKRYCSHKGFKWMYESDYINLNSMN